MFYASNKLVLICGFLLLILALRFVLFYHNQPSYHDSQNISFQTTLLSSPQKKDNQQRFHVDLENGQRIFIATSLYPEFNYAEKLYISGKLNEVRFENGNTIWTMYYPNIKVLKKADNLFLSITSFIRS